MERGFEDSCLRNWIKVRYTPTDAIKIIMEDHRDKMCESTPHKVRSNLSFVISSKIYSNWSDVKADMNGTYDRVIKSKTNTIEIVDRETKSTRRYQKKNGESEN